ncbi:hypothetical protein RvY_01701 [Ramazzottius varieornatus]|uniref:Uncharacterized protein n=1 Tax=Ramazzottius varieornatus TaxID=947166 RepID=A0A1D1UKN4_RAMVA|nr:hypothetical protein RvY_01701 [Ramazzottius varieornatus]
MDSTQSDPPEVPPSAYAPRHPRNSNVRDTFDSIAPFQPLRKDGCGVPRNLTREFHHFSIVPIEEVDDDEGCYIGDCDNPPKKRSMKTPSQIAMEEGVNGKHQKCWMAKDVVIDLIDNPNLDLEKYEEQKRKEDERIKLEELQRKAKQEASAKAKGRFNKALMATRMRNILNENIETMKLEREMGDCKPKRRFEDPLIRLQRRMINENKAHFIL